MTIADHRLALTHLQQLVEAMHPTDTDLKTAVDRCFQTLPEDKPFEMPSVTPVSGPRSGDRFP